MKRAKQSKAQTQAMSQSVVTNMSANINNYTANQIQALSSQYTDHSSSGKNIYFITIPITFINEILWLLHSIPIAFSRIYINFFYANFQIIMSFSSVLDKDVFPFDLSLQIYHIHFL